MKRYYTTKRTQTTITLDVSLLERIDRLVRVNPDFVSPFGFRKTATRNDFINLWLERGVAAAEGELIDIEDLVGDECNNGTE